MRWDANSEFKLLLKILETNPNFTFNAELVAESWGEGERPTARAIKDRLSILKKRAGLSPASTPNGSIKREGVAKSRSTSSKTTFRDALLASKSKAGTAKGKPANGQSGGRRGRNNSANEFDDSDDDDEDASEDEDKDDVKLSIKDQEAQDDSDSDVQMLETPSKPTRHTPLRSVRSRVSTPFKMEADGNDSEGTVQGTETVDVDSEEDAEFDIQAYRETQRRRLQEPASKVAQWKARPLLEDACEDD